MTKLFLIGIVLTTLFCYCNQPISPDKDKKTSFKQLSDTIKYDFLYGTWVRHDKTGFTLIEIKDTSNVFYCQFVDREIGAGKPISDRYWYYKSKATMGYWDNSEIWIATDKFRFDYKLKSDSLVEFDKMGDQGSFIKVYTDEQKDFKEFNAANLRGRINYMTRVNQIEFFVLDNIDREFSFISTAGKASNNSVFSDVAAIGDSVLKPPYSDTLTLFKRSSKNCIRYAFLRR